MIKNIIGIEIENKMTKQDIQNKIEEETILLVKLFLESNESDIELSKRTGISSSTVGRRLTNKNVILSCFPRNGEKIYEFIREKRKNNLDRAKVIGGQASMINNNENFTKLRLDAIYSDKKNQIKFLSHLALYFRAKLPLLSELFGIDEKVLLDELITNNKGCYESLLYLFYQDNYDQELAKEKIISYYKDLINAISKKDRVLQLSLISLIGDGKAKEFKEKYRHSSEKTDEDIMTLVMYQLKYGLSNKKLGEKFNVGRSHYAERVRKLLQNNEELLTRYNSLVNYYSERSAFNGQRSI